MRKSILIATILCLVSIIAGTLLVYHANFGVPKGWSVLTAIWLYGPGLPTFLAVTGLASVWGGFPLALFLICATLLGFAFQLLVVHQLRLFLMRRKRKEA